MRTSRFVFVLPLLVACGSPETTSSSSAPVIGGDASSSADDEVVLLAGHDPSKDTSAGEYFERCTGTLLAPNVVLTARHCISSTPNATFTCAEDGTIQSGTGGTIGADFLPSETYVFVGSQRPAQIQLSDFQAVASAFVHDDGTIVCNDDVALIVLAAPIPNAKIAPIRLDAPVTLGESLFVVGWGATLTESFPTTRQRRDGVTVFDVGPSATQRIGGQLGDREFLASESICVGDSGGPVFDATTGAVVGVVSRGYSGTSTQNGTGCKNTQHTVSETASFKSLVMQAFALAGGAPWIEGQPAPGTSDAGADSDAPGDVETEASGGGCAIARANSSSRGGWIVALAAVLVVLARRARARTRVGT